MGAQRHVWLKSRSARFDGTWSNLSKNRPERLLNKQPTLSDLPENFVQSHQDERRQPGHLKATPVISCCHIYAGPRFTNAVFFSSPQISWRKMTFTAAPFPRHCATPPRPSQWASTPPAETACIRCSIILEVSPGQKKRKKHQLGGRGGGGIQVFLGYSVIIGRETLPPCLLTFAINRPFSLACPFNQDFVI